MRHENDNSRTWRSSKFRIEIANRNSRSRIDQDEFESQGTWIEKSNFEKSNWATKFEKSNWATKRKFRRQIRIEIREVELSNETKISTTNSNRKLKFEKSNRATKFEKSNRATKRKTRIRNSTRKFKELELETRIENSTANSKEKLEFEIRHETSRNSNSKLDTKTQTRIENFRAKEKASRRTTDERREAHSHETRTRSHETAPERTPETHTSNERL